MVKHLSIDKNQKTPIYQQIFDAVIMEIENGKLSEGEQLPSINQIAVENKLARETVIRAFKLLQQKGIIRAVHGKGFFVASEKVNVNHRVFVLFDTFSPYKEVLYSSIKKEFGKNAFLDIYFHHFNIKIFNKLIEEASGNYTSYIISPFDNPKVSDGLNLLPKEKVYLVDRYSRFIKETYPAVCQDFSADVYSLLTDIKTQLTNYNSFSLVFRNTITDVPVELRQGFESFCQDYAINYNVSDSLDKYKPQKGDAFIVIDDEDLVYLVEQAKVQNLKIGKDLGIISYNETSLKKVVAGGISVISTDFAEMGKLIAGMIIDGKAEKVRNKSEFIDRGSF